MTLLKQRKVDLFTILVGLFLIIPISLHAQESEELVFEVDCSVPANIQKTRPNHGGEPTDFNIGFFLVDLKKIDDVSQSYVADIIFDIAWSDFRLSKNSLGRSLNDCVISLDDVWFPQFIDVNAVKSETLLPRVVHIDDEGNMRFRQRYIGEISSDLNFSEFPFDSQILYFSVVAYDYGPEEIKFSFNPDKFGIRKELSIEGWEIELEEPVITNEYIASENRNFARVDFRIFAEREKGYYVWKLLVPLCFIVLMAWAVFWIDPSAIGPQIGLSTATVFTLIAYRFSLGFQLPRVSYFTRMDKFVFLSTVLVFMALGTAIATSRIATQGNKELAIRIENWAKTIYLVIFALIIIFSLVI